MKTSDGFCILPWVHARLNQDGEVYPCCRISEFLSYGSLRKQEFGEIWNDRAIRELRLSMLRGEKPAPCSDCHRIEKLGGVSTRNEMNQRFASAIARTDQTREDGSIRDHLTPLYLDLRFSNVCNFRCRSCGPQNSTAWYQDAKGLTTFDLSQASRPTIDTGAYWKAIEPLLAKVERLYFAGGEPLADERHYELLEKLIVRGRTDIELDYNTNFSMLSLGGRNAVDLWLHFKSVRIGASLDAVGDAAELLRKGTRWSEIEENHRLLREKAPHVQFLVCSTLSVMNAFHITEAISRMIELGMIRSAQEFKLNVAYEPDYVSLGVLNLVERERVAEHYSLFISDLRARGVAGQLIQHVADELRRALGSLPSEPNPEARQKFRRYTFTLDQRRDERFVNVFPELFELLYADDFKRS